MENVILVGTIKKTEGNDPKNFSKKALGKLQKDEDSSQSESATSEQVSAIIEATKQKVNASEVILELSNELTAEIITIEETQPTSESIKVDVPLKPGQAIRNKFMELVTEGKITEEYIYELSTKEGTAKFFGVRYPFLKEFNPNISIKELTDINGHARYSSKLVAIGGRQYLITNDLYKATLPRFMDWTVTINKVEQVEV